MAIEYRNWREVPASVWRWPNFSPQEIACKGTGRLRIDPASMDALQALRSRLGKPLIITSAYRSPEHNRAVGGAPNSQHLHGKAFDVMMTNHNPVTFEAVARECGFRGFGHYPASNFMHIDTRAVPARWKGTGRNNAWFEARPETPGFNPPTRPPALSETVKELAPVVSPILVGTGAIAQGDGPVQWALGIIAVVGFVAAVVWFMRQRTGGENA